MCAVKKGVRVVFVSKNHILNRTHKFIDHIFLYDFNEIADTVSSSNISINKNAKIILTPALVRRTLPMFTKD
jgi:hypothetical protein